MTVEEIYKVLGVLSAVQEKQNQDQEAMDRRMNNTSGWKGF
tara:strand:+ start:275 stop:397 length:123 start_codon:yes stop_codon:yes gene_type:complete